MLRVNFLLAIGYFLTGYFGTLLSIPPNLGSPIWPAAGIALAGLLTYGNRAILGVWTGAFCLQLVDFLAPSPHNHFISSLFLATSISTIAVFQAIAGAWLIKRYVGAYKILTDDINILIFLLLAGPVSCTVSASLSLILLYLNHVISADNLALSWLVWWIGDIIGVLVFTPVLLCFIARPTRKWQKRIPTVAFPLMALFVLVTILFQFIKDQELSRLNTLFNERVYVLHNALQIDLDRHLEINNSVKALFESSHEVSADEFKNFTQLVLSNHPNIQALEWLPRITQENYASYPVFASGASAIHTIDGRVEDISTIAGNEFFPVFYTEPNEINKETIGLDASSEPVRLKAIQLARDTEKTMATELIKLQQDKSQRPGIQFFTPVYQLHQPLNTVEQRREYLLGIVSSSFVVASKVNRVKKQFGNLQLQIHITDAGNDLFNDSKPTPLFHTEFTGLTQSLPLIVANRQWNVTYQSTPHFDHEELSRNIWWFVLTGLLVTAITSAFLLMLTGRTLSIQDLVKIRTCELKRESNERQLIIQQHRGHNKILQAIASTEPLRDILHLIVCTSEKQFPGSVCSILLLHERGTYIHKVIAPNLPDYFVQALEGLAIGEGVCDFGTAAFIGQRVITENIEQHPYWQKLAYPAKQAGLAASWSEPILSSSHQTLGVFTVYHRTPFLPADAILSETFHLAQLASIAIERRASEKQIIHLAYYDALTNLPNRRLFFDQLEKTLAEAVRYKTHAALLYLDLDHFKTLNDSLGHDIGDELLIQVANRLKLCVRDEDTVARLGGDEFVLLLSSRETSKESMQERALTTAERVQSTLEVPYKLKGHIHHITPSIGITLIPQPDTTPGELLKQADTAMYHAKSQGRNSISFYSGDMQRRADQRLIMEKDLREALSDNQLSLYYQPQFDNDHRLIGAEALIRWRHPVKGMISPTEFIPVAEETSLILAISDWVLHEACLQLQKWSNLPHLAVNISPKQFRQPKFGEQIASSLTKHGISSSRLMLEITEGSIIDDIEDSIVKLQAMQNLGINISIDDFGTGYSSLAYLRMLPLNQLKIDQSFVRDINIDHNDAVIVETIISMSKHLGLSVIAEGVETVEQLEFLKERQCKGYQGYFFSKPLPANEFAAQFIEKPVTSKLK
ncbi:MAG: EAL domain-containing protein [Methylococcaceae bacterium]|nr:EAL domain-containing protein [Methylococcaceae bacterium]